MLASRNIDVLVVSQLCRLSCYLSFIYSLRFWQGFWSGTSRLALNILKFCGTPVQTALMIKASTSYCDNTNRISAIRRKFCAAFALGTCGGRCGPLHEISSEIYMSGILWWSVSRYTPANATIDTKLYLYRRKVGADWLRSWGYKRMLTQLKWQDIEVWWIEFESKAYSWWLGWGQWQLKICSNSFFTGFKAFLRVPAPKFSD